jgi:hypothetical protein
MMGEERAPCGDGAMLHSAAAVCHSKGRPGIAPQELASSLRNEAVAASEIQLR